MNLKKSKNSLQLNKISSSFILSGIAFSKSTRQPFNPYSTTSSFRTTGKVIRSKISKQRTEEQELTSLMKLRTNIKTRMHRIKDMKIDQLLSQQFHRINKRINKLTDNQMNMENDHYTKSNGINTSTETYTNRYPYQNKIGLKIEEERANSFNEKDNMNTQENEDFYKNHEEQELLFKRFNDVEKINKEIKAMNIYDKGKPHFTKDHPKYYFIREKVLLNSQPLFTTSYPRNNANHNNDCLYLNTTNLTLKSSRKPSFTLTNITQQQKDSHLTIFKAVPPTKKCRKLFLNTKLINYESKQGKKERPLTSNNSISTRNLSHRRFFNDVSSETATILTNTKEIENSIQDKYYIIHKTKEDLNKELLVSYTKRKELKEKEELHKSIQNIKNNQSNQKRFNSKAFKPLKAVPKLVKKSYTETCMKMEFENRILNPEAKFRYEPNEQKKINEKLNKKYIQLGQKQMNSIDNLYLVNSTKEEIDLERPPKENDYHDLDKLEWLKLKRRVLKSDRKNKQRKIHHNEK